LLHFCLWQGRKEIEELGNAGFNEFSAKNIKRATVKGQELLNVSHMTIQTTVLIETLIAICAEVTEFQ
jgi:S-adenosylhomocysteine hydrolase